MKKFWKIVDIAKNVGLVTTGIFGLITIVQSKQKQNEEDESS